MTVRCEALRDDLARLGEIEVRLPAWDPFLLGEVDRLAVETLPALAHTD